MKCRQCAEDNPADAVECRSCGAPLLEGLETGVQRSPFEGALAVEDLAPPEGEPGTLSGSARTEVMPDPSRTRRAPGPEATASAGGTVVDKPQVTGSIYAGSLASDSVVVQASGSTPGTAPPTIPVGSVFGSRYEILALLGQGGMGSVYSARDREVDRVIALKTIRGDSGDPTAIQRFKQELVLARKITHKNVIRIYDLGEAEGLKFFTMEYIEGENLKDLIRRRGRIPTDEVATIARQVLGALQEAHAQGVVHRDLKPQNIMLDKAGVPHLMDFGIARSADMTGMTGTGMIVGTPDYMSPEQVRGDKADERSDIFSFGVILYELLTADVPYHGDSPVSKIVMRLTERPRPPRELAAEIPPYMERIVLKCMEIEPALRYSRVGEILADLDRQAVDLSLTLKVQRLAVRNRGVIAAVVVALVLGGAGVYLAVGRRAPAAAPAASAPVKSLAIVPFTNATGSQALDWMRSGLPEMLVTDLAQSSYVRPISGERVQRVLQEAGLGQQARFDEAALEAVAKTLHADSVLSGQFVESGGRLRLDLTLRKAGSGVAVPLKVDGTSAEALALVDQITRRVKEQLDLSPEQIKGDVDRPIAEVSTASLEAQSAYQAGLAQLRAGANQDALPLLEKATAADPNFALAWAKLAEARFGAGLHDDAATAADRALTLSEKAPLPTAVRYQVRATVSLIKEDYDKAVAAYLELSKLYPNDTDVQFSLARAYEELGKHAEALEVYRKVVQAEPRYGAALLGLGRAQVLTGHAEEAIRSLQDALATKQFDQEPEALGMIQSILGVAYRDTSKLKEAMQAFQLSLKYRVQAGDKKGQAVTLYNIASIHEYEGEIDRALEVERRALALARELHDRAEESVALNNIALTNKAAGRLDKALAAFRESLQIEQERGDHRALGNRMNAVAEVYRLMGRYDDALVYLDQAKAHIAQSDEKEDQALNLSYRAQVRRAQGMYSEAIEAYLAALPVFKEIGQDMGIAIVQHDLGYVYMAQGRYGDARGAFEQSLALYKQLQVVHDLAETGAPLGRLLAALGRPDDAEKALAEAEHFSHEGHASDILPEVLLGQAEVASLRGQREQAAKLYEGANVKANLSGQKEIAVESRIELGLLSLEQGRLDAAERLLARTREEAAASRLRPLEAQAAAALAQVHLRQKRWDAAQREAQDAIRIADRFAGRPTLTAARAALGEALSGLGREAEALDAFAKALADLEWMRGSLRPDDVAPYMARPDVQQLLRTALARLDQGGRAAEGEPLRRFLAGPAAGQRPQAAR